MSVPTHTLATCMYTKVTGERINTVQEYGCAWWVFLWQELQPRYCGEGSDSALRVVHPVTVRSSGLQIFCVQFWCKWLRGSEHRFLCFRDADSRSRDKEIPRLSGNPKVPNGLRLKLDQSQFSPVSPSHPTSSRCVLMLPKFSSLHLDLQSDLFSLGNVMIFFFAFLIFLIVVHAHAIPLDLIVVVFGEVFSIKLTPFCCCFMSHCSKCTPLCFPTVSTRILPLNRDRVSDPCKRAGNVCIVVSVMT